jgi:hypothetical protein
LRLDEDEREHAAYLASRYGVVVKGKENPHVESIHLYKATADLQLVPMQFRGKLMGIIEQYTNGYTKLDGEKWVPAQAPKEF